MKNIILYGAPAAGKGTQCEFLVEKYGYKHISMGQLFRDLDDNSEFNKNIKKTIASGELVDDETTSQLLKNKLYTIKDSLIVLDGFPRNLNQAMILDNFFSDYVVINLDVDYDVAMKRTLGRMSCSKCGKIYNNLIQDMFPQKDGICDICGVELIKRLDDNEESFKTRFDIYMNNVKSVLDYYSDKDLLHIVKSISPQETFKDIESVVK